MSGLSVSVIIPAWNEAERIATQLEALARQTVAPTEIIVADNGSTDRTPDVVRKYIDEIPGLRLIEAHAVKGPSHARNEAARAARGEILAFCDADDEVDEQWLEELMAALDGADLVCGRLSTERLNDDVTASWRTVNDPGEGDSGSFLPTGTTSNMAIRRSLFLSVGQFDEAFGWAHDDEFVYRVQLAGHSYRFAPEARVHYRLKATARELVIREYQCAVGAARLYERFGAQGYPRRSSVAALKQWAWLAVHLVDLRSAVGRGRWLQKAASCLGRLRGSTRYRVFFP